MKHVSMKYVQNSRDKYLKPDLYLMITSESDPSIKY